MADHLPPEVLVDVFMKLPVKSILICTSVCKSWRSFIVNPSFINLHLNRPRAITYNNAQDLLVVRTCSEMTEEELYSLRCENEAFAEYAKLDFPFDRAESGYYRIVGSCDGVLCLTDDQWTYMDATILWNPTIRKWVKLPRPRVTFRSHGGFGHAFGFGFDAKSNDYKVVRIVYLDSGYRVPPEVDVYTLSTGTWRNISHLLLPYHIAERATQVYLNGASHWIGWDLKWTQGVVVSFDMVNEVFNYINLPAGVEFGFASPHTPAVIQGSLSLVERIGSGDEQVYCIWVMKEYGVASSWTKQLHIGIDSSIGRLIGFRKKGELLFAARGDLICFNPESAKVRVLGIRSKTGDWNSYSFYADSYIESLVLLGIVVHIEENEDDSEEEDNKVVAGLQNQNEENEEEEMKPDGRENEPGSDEEEE